jgi:diamine N-acetyltransferase
VKEKLMAVSLRPITKENWEQCALLEVCPGQEDFVMPNVWSIAQAYADPVRVPLAIYDDETVVGFVMYNDRPLHDGTYRISRVLIGCAHQGKGYGRAAVTQVIERMRQIADCTEITLEYAVTNDAAKHLYSSMGFEPVGRNWYGHIEEVVTKLRL